jgi:peptide/nickel transport system permease protein
VGARTMEPSAAVRRRGDFVRFLAGRALGAAGLLVAITLVTFTLVTIVPADPVAANLGEVAAQDPDIVAAYRERHGLDEPLPIQYWRYLKDLAHGDLGTSTQSGRPVRDELREYVPATLELAVPAALIAFVVSVALGALAAARRGGAVDQGVRLISLAGVSTPPFWLALLALYIFFFRLRLLPGPGRLSPEFDPPPHVTGMFTVDSALAGEWDKAWDALQHAVLPIAVIAMFAIGVMTRFVRAAFLDVLQRDYVSSAWSRGLRRRTVWLRYILRPALLPVITLAGLLFGSLLAGAVLVEQIFSWPGLGQYAYRSAYGLDLQAIMGVALFVAVVYVVVNLVVDVLYGILDPRIRVH